MAELKTRFGGLELKNPVVMASAPPTETVESICRCTEAGASAAIIKTMSDFEPTAFPLGARRAFQSGQGFWAFSTFRREALTIDNGAELIRKAVLAAGVPIFASVGGLDLNTNSWYPACLAAQQAGASLIQLDLFYLPHPRCSSENITGLRQLMSELDALIDVPIMPKLNIDLPPHLVADFLPAINARGVILLDSLRTPVPIDVLNDGRPKTPYAQSVGECSLFGEWQKPLTLQYVKVLSTQTKLDILAGGGLMNGNDAAEAILLGATAVQFASAVILHGYRQIARILDEIEQIVVQGKYGTIANMRGRALQHFGISETDAIVNRAEAIVDNSICTNCGLCRDLVFCSNIVRRDNRINILPECEGCGLCVSCCPTPGALSLRPTNNRGGT